MTYWGGLRDSMVIWEDDYSVVLNKPPGISVMGERHDTDLVTMAADAGERLWWVNRIDKVTSGAVVLAKTQKAHGVLTRQFAKRSVDKAYLAVCQPGRFPDHGTIDLPLLTASSGRIRVAAERQNIRHDSASGNWYIDPADLLAKKSYPSQTDFVNIWDDEEYVVVLAMPITGRRHQIRVHLAWVGHAIVGDPLFAKKTDEPIPRTYLHSLRIAFETAAQRPRWIEVEAEPSVDFWDPVATRLEPRSSTDMLAAADAVLSDRDSAASARTATLHS